MPGSSVLYQVDNEGIATLTLNRPEVHNAFDDVMIADLTETFAGIAEDEDIVAVVVSARGRSFSAGADIGWMRQAADYTEEENLEDARRLAEMLYQLYSLPQPTIAKVQGSAYGGGVGLIAACDVAIAVRSAQFSFSEVNLGLIPAVISPYVIAAIGPRQARRFFLSAERFDAVDAMNCGLVHHVQNDAGELQATCDRYVRAFIQAGPAALTAAKELISHVAARSIDEELIENTVQRIAHLRTTAEAKERLAAFLDKSPPSGPPVGRRQRG